MKIPYLLLVGLLTQSANAAIVPTITDNALSLLSPNNLLSINEKVAVSLAKKWMDGKTKPITKGDGSVTYFYGATLPTVVCAPLKICDIQLEAGERILKNGLKVADTVRWGVSPMVSGEGGNAITHVTVKPSDSGLDTNMVIATDKRTYNIKLVSRKNDWMPTINFDYPEQIHDAIESLYAKQAEANELKILGDGLNIDNLSFNYNIEGKAPFVPIRVYNNSVKTILDMPRTVATGKLPSLLVVNANKRELINYRYRNGKFIVDGLPQQIILLLGSGKQQQSVLITKKG